MRSTKIKALLLAGASFLTILSIFGATFLIGNLTTHAASPNPYQVSASALKNATPQFASLGPRLKSGMHSLAAACNNGLPLDSVPSFCGTYTVPGYGPDGVTPQNTWTWQMLGNAPKKYGFNTTLFNAPVIPVRVQLLNADGSVAYTYDPLQFLKQVLESPVFSYHKYTSSFSPTQITDAVQRAEFFNEAQPDWHTLLLPEVKRELTMKLPYGSYQFATNPDGTCCEFILADANTFENLLFPPTFPVDNSTVIGAAELSGEMTTKDISTLLFPNTYLYVGDVSNCCILGFHTFDFEPGVPSNGNRDRAYVVNYSSWISPGLFNGGFQDVTALSHEMAETFNDPFVTAFNNFDVTPWWSSGGNCQDDLEVGDVIEGLPNATYPIKMNGYTYHPQNEALLQWFESNGKSNAINHAYSYPDETVLTSSNVSLNPATNPACGVGG